MEYVKGILKSETLEISELLAGEDNVRETTLFPRDLGRLV